MVVSKPKPVSGIVGTVHVDYIDMGCESKDSEKQ